MACYRRKSTVWPGKLISSKKTPKNSIFLRQNMGITSLWEDLEAKLLTPGQLLGYPWKLGGMTVQTSYVGGQWHQNWTHTSCQLFFCRDKEIGKKKVKFLVKCSVPENYQKEIFWGDSTHGTLRTNDSEKIIGLGEPLFRSHSGSKWGHRPKNGCVTKNQWCNGSKSIFVRSLWNE